MKTVLNTASRVTLKRMYKAYRKCIDTGSHNLLQFGQQLAAACKQHPSLMADLLSTYRTKIDRRFLFDALLVGQRRLYAPLALSNWPASRRLRQWAYSDQKHLFDNGVIVHTNGTFTHKLINNLSYAETQRVFDCGLRKIRSVEEQKKWRSQHLKRQHYEIDLKRRVVTFLNCRLLTEKEVEALYLSFQRNPLPT